jgi:16S rRNA (uracil1498-N3)-methyltransferase
VNLILLEPEEVGADGRVTLGGVRARHVTSVLRAATGDELRVGVIDGPIGIGRVSSLDNGAVGLECRLDSPAPPRPRVDLLLALPRPKVMRRLWAQLAALGVGRIILTNAARVERDYFDTHVLTPECYRPLLVEGLQQARDTRLPAISIHRRFKPLVEDDLDGLSDARVRLAAQPGSDLDSSKTGTLENHDLAPEAGARALLAVGPEGGWNDFELRLLDARGFRAISLGPRTLRTDTATIALVALVHDALRARTP